MATDMEGLCPNCFSFQYQKSGCPVCGYIKPEQPEGSQILAEGTMLANRYIIGCVLGIGGFGITYKAFDNLLKECCAVKEFAPVGLFYRTPGETAMQVSESVAGTWYRHGLQRFIEEAQTLKRLENISGVVEVKECFQANNTAYFTMELLEGVTLKKIIRNTGGAVDFEDLTKIIAVIGNAMETVHRTTGILHRDITPENIFLKKNGEVKLIDFGSARQQTRNEQEGFSVEYKQGFAPPEQYSRNGRQGPYTDVYALASSYYNALTGIRIPDAMDRLNGASYVPLCELRSDVPVDISMAVDQALELDYQKRTQTMGEFVYGISHQRQTEEAGEKPKKQQVPYLEIVSGLRTGARWKLPANTKINIGRSHRQSNIIIQGDNLISKIHCCIIYDDQMGQFLMEDFSRNGVYINNRRLEKGKRYSCGSEVVFSLASRNCIVRAGLSSE